MALNYRNLDSCTRNYMVKEIEFSIDRDGGLYKSRVLTGKGLREWPDLLTDAAKEHDDGWLARQVRMPGRMRQLTAAGRRVAVNAHETLAESEFNHFYVRAICRRAIAERKTVVVYRAKPVAEERSSSRDLIGQERDACAVLEDLRDHPGSIGAEFYIPGGPNSGISLELVDDD